MIKFRKKNLDIFLYIFVLVSLIFLFLHLQKHNLLYVPEQINYGYLAISFFFLCLGFCFNCVSWSVILRNNGINLPLKDAVISIGISIFGKYIPGKVWMIAGMSGKVVQATGAKPGRVAFISTLMQLVIILTGSVVGLFSLKNLVAPIYIVIVYLIVILGGMIFFIYKNKLIALISKSTRKIAQKWLLPLINSVSIPLILAIIGIWFCWSVGFYLLGLSLFPDNANLLIGFSFSLAASLGILVVFAPGGLGVREGLLGLLLATFIGSTKDVATLAAFSRLWFLGGELFMFLTALALIALVARDKRKKI